MTTFFTNPNFIDHILKTVGGSLLLGEGEYSTLQTLIELQTRLLLQTAIKFMHKDFRDDLSFEDILLATKEMNHPEMKLDFHCRYSMKEDIANLSKIYQSAQEIIEQQMSGIAESASHTSRLTGRWIYIKNTIVQTNSNIHLRSLSQVLKLKQDESIKSKRDLKVIRDDPYSLLTKEQLEYFQKIVKVISENANPKGQFHIEGDLNSLFPFILKFLGEKAINATGTNYLLRLLQNKYIWSSVEYNLKKVLNILLSYRGTFSFEVGIKIAQIVQRFSDKYPILRDIYVGYDDDSYSTILKKIPFELELGIPLELSQQLLSKMKEESETSNQMAKLCMVALLTHSAELKIFKRYLSVKNTFVYWYPCQELKNDPYMTMF